MYNNYRPVVSPFFVFSQIVVKFAINKIVATVLQNTKIQEVDRGSFMYNLQLSVDLPPIGLSIAYFLNNKKKLYGVERLVAIQNLITSTFVYLHYFNFTLCQQTLVLMGTFFIICSVLNVCHKLHHVSFQ
jgi:hypothetical protein